VVPAAAPTRGGAVCPTLVVTVDLRSPLGLGRPNSGVAGPGVDRLAAVVLVRVDEEPAVVVVVGRWVAVVMEMSMRCTVARPPARSQR
jgi:hypothetical protein